MFASLAGGGVAARARAARGFHFSGRADLTRAACARTRFVPRAPLTRAALGLRSGSPPFTRGLLLSQPRPEPTKPAAEAASEPAAEAAQTQAKPAQPADPANTAQSAEPARPAESAESASHEQFDAQEEEENEYWYWFRSGLFITFIAIQAFVVACAIWLGPLPSIVETMFSAAVWLVPSGSPEEIVDLADSLFRVAVNVASLGIACFLMSICMRSGSFVVWKSGRLGSSYREIFVGAIVACYSPVCALIGLTFFPRVTRSVLSFLLGPRRKLGLAQNLGKTK